MKLLLLFAVLLLSTGLYAQEPKCDTLWVEDCFSIFNTSPLTAFDSLTPYIVSTDTIRDGIRERSMVTVQFQDSTDLYYTWCNPPYIQLLAESDREYFSCGGQKYLIDLFFHRGLYDVTYYSFGDFRSYSFQVGNSEYIAVFIENAVVQMTPHGYSMYLFYVDQKTKVAELILYNLLQIAPDIRSFGYSEDGKSLLFYSWGITSGSFDDFVDVMPINGKRVDLMGERINWPYTWIDRGFISICR
ncbi:hypothetical protein DSECCO2_597300 [anaerobic digester metagenome]